MSGLEEAFLEMMLKHREAMGEQTFRETMEEYIKGGEATEDCDEEVDQ